MLAIYAALSNRVKAACMRVYLWYTYMLRVSPIRLEAAESRLRGLLNVFCRSLWFHSRLTSIVPLWWGVNSNKVHSPAATGARRGPVRVRGPQESAGELYWTSRQLSFELTRRAGPQSCETKSEAPQLKRARRRRTPERALRGMKTGGSGAMFNTGAAARGGSPHKFGDQRYASSSYCAGVLN